MSIFLSEQIKKMEGSIQLNFFVKSIEQNDQKVIVTSIKG